MGFWGTCRLYHLVCLGLDVAVGCWGFAVGWDFAAGLEFAMGIEIALGKARHPC